MDYINLSNLIKEYKWDKSKQTERGELLRQFIENINEERDKKLRPLTFSRMAFLLQHISNEDLYPFLSMCNDRKTRNGKFSSFFWWAIKSK